MSKGLEALKDIKENIHYGCFLAKDWDRLDIIEKELKDYEETKQDLEQVMKDYQDLGNRVYKELKALEIVKKHCDCETTYDFLDKKLESKVITQEEYELLKEVLL